MIRLLVCAVFACMAAIASAQTATTGGATMDSGGAGFFEFGAGVGSPSGVCLIGGYDAGLFAGRLSGGYWKKGWNGVQADIAINFIRSSSLAMGASLLGGRFVVNPLNERGEEQLYSVRYLGVAYDIYLAGFFLQAGLAGGKGDYPNPQAIIQVGYLFAI